MDEATHITTCLCPLCGNELDVQEAGERVSAQSQDVLVWRKDWAAIAAAFTAQRSLSKAALQLAMPEEEMLQVLNFLCLEVCGCRTVTCPPCLDDYRSVL